MNRDDLDNRIQTVYTICRNLFFHQINLIQTHVVLLTILRHVDMLPLTDTLPKLQYANDRDG